MRSRLTDTLFCSCARSPPRLQVKGDERVRYLTEAEIDAHLTAIAERE